MQRPARRREREDHLVVLLLADVCRLGGPITLLPEVCLDVAAGILESKRGKVRLLRPDELPADWDPANDSRLTAWEAVHHLIHKKACAPFGIPIYETFWHFPTQHRDHDTDGEVTVRNDAGSSRLNQI